MANHKVSLEEMRARRLAKEQQESQNETDSPGVLAEDIGHGLAETAEAQPPADSLPQPAPAPEPSPVAASPIVVPNLDDFLASATPEQLQKIRILAASKGLSVPAAGSGTKRADGSMTVEVNLPPEIVQQLEIWSEPGGLT